MNMVATPFVFLGLVFGLIFFHIFIFCFVFFWFCFFVNLKEFQIRVGQHCPTTASTASQTDSRVSSSVVSIDCIET